MIYAVYRHRRARMKPAVYLAGFFWLLSGGNALAHQDLLLAVHPYLPFEEILIRFTPLANYIEESTNLTVEIRVGVDYESHMLAIAEGEADLAFIGPSTYLNMTKLYGTRPIICQIETLGEPSFHGHFVVVADSPLNDLSLLAGKQLAFTDRFSTMYEVPVAMMLKAGIPRSGLDNIIFMGGHKDVALGVLAGDFSAGVIKDEVFIEFQSRGLKSLAETPTIPEHLFVASQDLHVSHLTELRAIFLELNDHERGREILRMLKPSCTGTREAEDSVFDSLREFLAIIEEPE